MKLHNLKKFIAFAGQFESAATANNKLSSEKLFELTQLPAELTLPIGIARCSMADALCSDDFCERA
jgi:hypothetical protein